MFFFRVLKCRCVLMTLKKQFMKIWGRSTQISASQPSATCPSSGLKIQLWKCSITKLPQTWPYLMPSWCLSIDTRIGGRGIIGYQIYTRCARFQYGLHWRRRSVGNTFVYTLWAQYSLHTLYIFQKIKEILSNMYLICWSYPYSNCSLIPQGSK